jgi:hypothetical protein
MTIHIISIDHYLQYQETENDRESLRSLKRELAAMIGAYLEGGRVSAIFEESSPKKITIAQKLAAASSPPIRWTNIDMTEEQRRNAGIFEALQKRPAKTILGPLSYEIEYRIPEDEIREEYFLNRIEEAAYEDGTVLVLLGDMHVLAVAEKLRAHGHEVETFQRLVPVRRWAVMPGPGGSTAPSS